MLGFNISFNAYSSFPTVRPTDIKQKYILMKVTDEKCNIYNERDETDER